MCISQDGLCDIKIVSQFSVAKPNTARFLVRTHQRSCWKGENEGPFPSTQPLQAPFPNDPLPLGHPKSSPVSFASSRSGKRGCRGCDEMVQQPRGQTERARSLVQNGATWSCPPAQGPWRGSSSVTKRKEV